MSTVVLFKELESPSNKKIGVATLNSEKSLNSLSLEMVNLLMPQLLAWQADSSIAKVMLEGAGEKAFCAGGAGSSAAVNTVLSFLSCGFGGPLRHSPGFRQRCCHTSWLVSACDPIAAPYHAAAQRSEAVLCAEGGERGMFAGSALPRCALIGCACSC